VGPAYWNRSVSSLWIVRSSVGLHKEHPPQRTASGWIQKGWVPPADCASLLQAGKWPRGGNYHGSHVH
jgi:hypothetical protein